MKKTLTFALAFSCFALGLSRSSFAQDNATRTPVPVLAETGNRKQDRLNGPVRRVRVETAKILPKDGNWVEGPRGVLGIATYDPAGRKIDSIAYPVEGSTLSGKEQYLYDDKGNVVEMILRGTDGSMLSRQSYKYEFDQLGNWTKMSSSVAVYENGSISFEPTEITYRTISYYYNQAIEKLNAPSPKSKGVSPPSTASTRRPDSEASSTDSPRPSPTAQVSTTIQPLSEAVNVQARKEAVSAPASVAPVTSSTPAPDGPVATSSEAGTTTDNASANSEVQHLAEDVLSNAAIELPKPEYSDAALLARASGKVKVQILVDENGHVTNAQATSGHPLLGAAAEAAARKARFSLTKVSSAATKVYGVISYDFVLPTLASEASPATSPTIDRNPPKLDDRKPEARPIPEGADLVESKPKASANYSEAARSFYNKGVTLQASGRYAEAAEAFNQSIRLNPNDAIAYLKLGLAYSGLRQYKEAIVGFKFAARIKREVVDAEGYYRWGYAYSTLGKFSDAQDAFKQALYVTRAEAADPSAEKAQNSPLLEEIHYSLGFAYLNAKRYNDAVRELKEAISLNPQLVEAYYGLGLAYIGLGNRNSAERQREILNSLKSPSADKLAKALLASGVNESALRKYRVAN